MDSKEVGQIPTQHRSLTNPEIRQQKIMSTQNKATITRNNLEQQQCSADNQPINKKPNTKATKRRVRFDSSVKTIDIPTCNIHEDGHQLWYTGDEMMMMKMSGTGDIKNKMVSKGYCISSETFSETRRQVRQEARLDVLCQQELLWDDGVEDPEMIAEVYMEATGTTQWEATQRGIRHAKHVLEMLGAKKMKKRRSSGGNVRQDRSSSVVVSCCDDKSVERRVRRSFKVVMRVPSVSLAHGPKTEITTTRPRPGLCTQMNQNHLVRAR